MSNFDEVFERLNRESPSRNLQISVGEIIAEALEQARHSLGYWEKECLAQAIAAFGRNLGSGENITDLWLRLSLVSAEKALVPKERRMEAYSRQDSAIDVLTYEQLSEALRQLREGL